MTTDSIRANFIGNITDKQWEIIADSLFQSQERERERLSNLNAGDTEWNKVDDTYSLYLNIHTFILS